jgi:hypothetical protein
MHAYLVRLPLTAAQSTAVKMVAVLSFSPPPSNQGNRNSRHRLVSRQGTALYPNKDGGVSSSCGESIPYSLLGDGTLSTLNGIIVAPADADSFPFKPTANPGPNDVPGAWQFTGAMAAWMDPTFDGGVAIICMDSTAGATGGISVYVHGTPPNTCTPLTFGSAPGKLGYPL